MLLSTLVALTLPTIPIRAVQVPLQTNPQATFPNLQAPEHRWNFEIGPSPNATANYIFETVASLLHQWPNTRYRNGHSIVPGTIPVGTLLYHGTWHNQVPTVPDWVATDPEHANWFCRTIEEDTGCWQLTLAVTRPLKVLYFDGSSAAKVLGAMDAQDVLLWGEPKPERVFDESNRIKDLCRWGKKYNIDGFLRMEMDFEIMLCDFTAGVEVASFLNLVSDRRRPPRPTVERCQNSSRPVNDDHELSIDAFRALESGQWHNRYPGETRAKLDLTRLVSFYDADLFPSLLEARHGQERWDHRVAKLGEDGRQTLLRRLDDVLHQDLQQDSGSGVDWASLIRVIIHRYSDRLEAVQYMLNTTSIPKYVNEDTEAQQLRNVHQYVASMLSPYIINHVRPNSPNPSTTSLAWAAPVFEQCATTHTKIISTSLQSLLTRSERLILSAVESVSHEICRVVVGIWADGVVHGLDNDSKVSHPKLPLSRDIAANWSFRIGGLMQWLDWSVWVKCRPACSFEETCYLPTWPWLHQRWSGPLPLPKGMLPDLKRERVWGWAGPDDEDYRRRPQPRCIRRLAPLEMP